MYSKTNWQDRIVQNPSTYSKRENADGTLTLTPAPGVVTNQGTPIKAEYMNKIELGLEDAHNSIDSIMAGTSTVPKSTSATSASNSAKLNNKSESQLSVDNANKWGNYQIRVGNYSSGAVGFITFSKS